MTYKVNPLHHQRFAKDEFDEVITGQTDGESISVSELCYLSSDGKWYLTDANAEATTIGLLGIKISAGKFRLWGSSNITGLASGGTYHVGEISGGVSINEPFEDDATSRIVGYSNAAGVLFFNPSSTYFQVTEGRVPTMDHPFHTNVITNDGLGAMTY